MPPAQPARNGLSGIWGQIGQMTAVGIIGLLVLLQQRDTNATAIRASQEAHQDRVMFAEMIDKLRNDQQIRWEKTYSAHSASQDQIRQDFNRAIVLMEKAVDKRP
jgi:hypothetical protein